MARGIEQAQALVLAVDIGEQRACFFQQAGADGAIIQEGARRPAFSHDAPEHKRLIVQLLQAACG